MDKEIKVSVIVPVYNAMEYLAQTAECIGNQTLKEIEIIYVDDGSTDGTLEILKTIEKSDERVSVYTQQNSYAGVARNTGMEKAKGKYLVFWDSDDIFLPEALEEMYLKCEEDNADICICGADHYDEENGQIYQMSTYLKKKMLPENTPFTHGDIDKYLFNFSTNVPWNKMFRREFIIDNNITFQPIKRANDNYFVMLAFFYAKTFTIVDKALIRYRINYGTSLVGEVSKDPLCVYEAYKATYDKLSKEENFDAVRQSFMNKVLRGFCYFMSKHTEIEACKILYNYYKNEVFTKWWFPEEVEFYYDEKDYYRLKTLLNVDCSEYIMSEYHNAFEELRILKNKTKIQKQTIKSLKIELKEAAKENKKLNSRINDLENSSSYKIGKKITFLPGKIKNIISNGEKKK